MTPFVSYVENIEKIATNDIKMYCYLKSLDGCREDRVGGRAPYPEAALQGHTALPHCKMYQGNS